MKRTAEFLSLSATILALSACGGSAGSLGTGSGPTTAPSAEKDDPPIAWAFPDEAMPGLRQRVVGHGSRGAVLVSRAGRPTSRKVVVFLHSLTLTPPVDEDEWLRHLVREGNSVVYPAYEKASGTPPEDFRANALAGISAGLRTLHADPRSVVAIGRTTGGALAFDYAAVAAEAGIPGPRAVVAIFPGRRPATGEVTPADLSRIPPETWLAVIAGPGDAIPDGEAEARVLLRGATRVPPAHQFFWRPPFPSLSSGASSAEIKIAARRYFWTPVDRLIAEARGEVSR
jgi:alpha/beta hydrolase fold